MLRYLIPLFLFVGLVILFIFGLQNDPRKVPSPLIDKPAPAFNLPTLHNPETTISLDELKGEVIGHSQPSTQTVPSMPQQNLSWRC